jgi:hypothetical protein
MMLLLLLATTTTTGCCSCRRGTCLHLSTHLHPLLLLLLLQQQLSYTGQLPTDAVCMPTLLLLLVPRRCSGWGCSQVSTASLPRALPNP